MIEYSPLMQTIFFLSFDYQRTRKGYIVLFLSLLYDAR